jgi:hypothetical protein
MAIPDPWCRLGALRFLGPLVAPAPQRLIQFLVHQGFNETRTRSRIAISMGSNHASPSRTGDVAAVFLLCLSMVWSPSASHVGWLHLSRRLHRLEFQPLLIRHPEESRLAIKGRFGKTFGFRPGLRRREVSVDSSLTSFFAEDGSFAEAPKDKPEAAPRWGNEEAGITEGKALLKRGDVAGAVALWEQVGEAFPESVAVFQQPSSFLMQARRLAEAKAVVSRGLERFPGDRRMMVDLAWTLHQLGEFPEALDT